MFCFRVRKRLIPYLEGGLDPRGAEAVAQHLRGCSRCAGELSLLRSASSVFRSAKMPAMEPAPDLWERIERRILGPAPAAAGPRWYLRGAQVGGAAVAAALILFAAVNVTRLGNTTGSPTKESASPGKVSIGGGTRDTTPPPVREPVRMGGAGGHRTEPGRHPGEHGVRVGGTGAAVAIAVPTARERPAGKGVSVRATGAGYPSSGRRVNGPAVGVPAGAPGTGSPGLAKEAGADTEAALLANGEMMAALPRGADWVDLDGLGSAGARLSMDFGTSGSVAGFVAPPSVWAASRAVELSAVTAGPEAPSGSRNEHAAGAVAFEATAVSSSYLRFGVEPGSAPTTTVDLMNKADLEARRAVLFSYP